MSRTSYPSPASSLIDSQMDELAPASPQHISIENRNRGPISLQVLQAMRHSLQARDRDADYGPRHGAILLTGATSGQESNGHDSIFDLDRLRSSLPTSPNEELGSIYNRAPLDSITENSPGNTPPPAPLLSSRSLQSPVSPPSLRIPRRIMLERNLRRRDFAEEQSATSGQRTLIREPSRFVESPVEEEPPVTFPPVSRVPRRLPIAVREVRERRSAPDASVRNGPASSGNDDRISQSLDESPRRTALSWRQSVHSTTSTLSSIGGSLDMQNFQSPPDSLPAMLFEPTSFTHLEDSARAAALRYTRDPETRPFDPQRDGEFWAINGPQPLRSRRNRRDQPYPSPATQDRLDELVYDWEEATRQRWGEARDFIDSGYSRVSELIPVTGEIMEGLDSDEEDSDYQPRVRLNSRSGELECIPPCRCDCELPITEDSKYYGRTTPFYVDPLPMPLVDMLPAKPPPPAEVRVYRAVTAGR
ncbi:hypothetical protein BDZ89DRAFT_1060468 [Hymenopellis radicata]|nr:hypothetical protein BDZ89DRAFT_1060468 [Hymenopellis radicata]